MAQGQPANPAPSPSGKDAIKSAVRPRPQKKSLTETVYERLRKEIITCLIAPGAELSEAELAERFSVSKTPVREALAMLRLDGLIRTFPRRGYQVTPITFADINALFEIRTILESGAGDLACQRIGDHDLENLSRLATAEYSPEVQNSLPAFIAQNRKFHLAIAEASGNSRLATLLNKQLEEMERFFYLGATLRDVRDETNADHRKIVEVLALRDPAKAREIIIHHNNVTRGGLLRALTQSPNFGSLSL